MQYMPNEDAFHDAHTDSVELTHADCGTLALSGNAWREIESQNAVSNLIMLFAIDQAAARKVVEIAAKQGCVISTIVTRDETASCRVITLGADEDAIEVARDSGVFVLDEGNYKDRSQHSAGDADVLTIGEYIEELLQAARKAEKPSGAQTAPEVVTAVSNLMAALQWEIDYGERRLGDDTDIVSAMKAVRNALI